MADFSVALNRDLQLVKTSARWDANANTWLHDVANFVLNDSGIWVPVSSTNPMPIKLTGSKARISSAPVTGVKTVTSTPAEIFAGSARKAGRAMMLIRNLDAAVRIRIGGSTVTASTGFGVEPMAVIELAFDPASDVPIYAVSEAGNVSVEVFEA